MRRFVSLPVVLIAITCSICVARAQTPFKLPPPASPADALRRAFYAYDNTLPLNAELKSWTLRRMEPATILFTTAQTTSE